MARSNILQVKNLTGSTISATKAVYISGFDEATQTPTVSLASNNSEITMPAVGVVRDDILNGALGVVTTLGPLDGFDTLGTNSSEPVYVGQNGNIEFSIKPSDTNESYISQQLGTVTRIAGGDDGQIHIYPLEVNKRTEHPNIITITSDQHHSKNHANRHRSNGADSLNHDSLSSLNTRSHSQYSTIDGKRAFIGVVSGVTPTADAHLSTKAYVDTAVAGGGGGGNVSKVGTPVNNQIGVWTGDGTIGGDTNFVYDGADVGIGTDSPKKLSFGSQYRVLTMSSLVSGGASVIELEGKETGIGDIGVIAFINDGDSVAAIQGMGDGNNTDSGALKFYTQTTGDSVNRQRMVIDSTGDVAIGLGVPAVATPPRLTIADNGQAEVRIWLYSTNWTLNGNWYTGGEITSGFSATGFSNSYIKLRTSTSNGVFATALYANNSKVSIGTNTAPINTLDVKGACVIGATYSGTETAPTNGLAVETKIGIGTVTVPHAAVGIAMLALEGPKESTAGPHIQLTNPEDDNYPIMQIFGWNHDNTAICFDSFFDGSNWKSGDIGSNFRIRKNADTLTWATDTGITAGATVTFVTAMTLYGDGGLTLGTPTGNSKGLGTLNAVEVYADDSLLTCYVLEKVNNGFIDLQKWNNIMPGSTEHEPAKQFKEERESNIDINQYASFWKENGHLPAFPSYDEWEEKGSLSTGKLIQCLWETVEVYAVHINKLNERLEILENKELK